MVAWNPSSINWHAKNTNPIELSLKGFFFNKDYMYPYGWMMPNLILFWTKLLDKTQVKWGLEQCFACKMYFNTNVCKRWYIIITCVVSVLLSYTFTLACPISLYQCIAKQNKKWPKFVMFQIKFPKKNPSVSITFP
jgi:hypothetical protein